MILTLIGMSNSGKSFWSNHLEQKGFKKFCCDDMIEQKLSPILIQHGFSGIHDISRWLGQPYEKQYPENSKIYLSCETQAMKEILEYIEITKNTDVVIDTTGSVIHTDNIILQKIRMKTKIIFLKTPYTQIQEMLKLYLEYPKPVIWGNIYQKNYGESEMDALASNYPRLLSFRRLQYNRFAHLSIDTARLKELTADKFIEEIRLGVIIA